MYNRTIIGCGECENTQCFIKLCKPEYISSINKKKNQIVLEKNQCIFPVDSPVFGIYFIQQGKVKVITSNLDGKEQIVRLAGDGHILGHRGYGGETYSIGAVTLDDTRLCFFDNNTLYDAFKKNFELLYNIMMFYSRELRNSEQRTKCFAQMTIDEKIIFALLYVIETYGFSEEKKLLNATLSRQDIADIAGTNSDQVSRSMAFLKKKRFISVQGKKIFIENYKEMKNSIDSYCKCLFPAAPENLPFCKKASANKQSLI